MTVGFWEKLHKPFSVLAPMADVTDVAFRSVIASCGRPDVFYTEFVSAHGLASAGRDRLILDLALTETDHPIVAQFFGTKPEHLFAAGALARELGFDGVDINMGCPDKGVMRQGAGVSLVKTPLLARDLVAALREGAGGLPVAVKTRLGLYKTEEMEGWIGQLLLAKPDVLILHGRTMKEASKVPAHWDLIGRAAGMCHEAGVLCVGNGDITYVEEGIGLAQKWGTDGYMVGRGIFHNPWLFRGHDAAEHTPEEHMKLLLTHTQAWVNQWNPSAGSGQGLKSFDLMKKFFKVYISGWPGAAQLRAQLMESKSADDVRALVTGQIKL